MLEISWDMTTFWKIPSSRNKGSNLKVWSESGENGSIFDVNQSETICVLLRSIGV